MLARVGARRYVFVTRRYLYGDLTGFYFASAHQARRSGQASESFQIFGACSTSSSDLYSYDCDLTLASGSFIRGVLRIGGSFTFFLDGLGGESAYPFKRGLYSVLNDCLTTIALLLFLPLLLYVIGLYLGFLLLVAGSYDPFGILLIGYTYLFFFVIYGFVFGLLCVVEEDGEYGSCL